MLIRSLDATTIRSAPVSYAAAAIFLIVVATPFTSSSSIGEPGSLGILQHVRNEIYGRGTYFDYRFRDGAWL